MDRYFFPFVLHCFPLAFTNMRDVQRGKSSFKFRYTDGKTSSFYGLNMDLGWRWDNISCQDFDSCCKGDIISGNMMFSICSCVRLFDSIVYSSQKIGIDLIYGALLDLRKYLVTSIECPLKNSMMYLMLSGSFVFTSNRSTI